MRVTSVRQLVQALGGPKKAGLALGVIPQKVNNWRAANRIPPIYFMAHQARLARRHISAPPELWSQTRLLMSPSEIEKISEDYQARRTNRRERATANA